MIFLWKWLCSISVYENRRQSYFYGKENNKEKRFSNSLYLQKRRFQKKLPYFICKTTTATVYTAKQTDKKAFYRFLLEKHRNYYSLPITATTTTLDTLFYLQPNELVVISPDHYKLWTKRKEYNASLEKRFVSFKRKHLKPIHRK
jgi:hypothetical protein